VPVAYPILLDVSTLPIVIVGGGGVALRKAFKLLEAGATRITAVAPKFVDSFPASVHKIAAEFKPEHLVGARMVFAATDSQWVNDLVTREARKIGALVNRADAENGDFTVPAVLRQSSITAAVWSDSPALSAFVRDHIGENWNPHWTALAIAMQTFRPRILASNLTLAHRSALLRELASEAALKILAAEGTSGLERWFEIKMREMMTEK